ncbi:FAD/NAD(P)-binding protein [Apiospora saccharicola]|uniref:FAD/NAD(P)-binding protein n=1 Tax=Apiospora saccharicola TaxID=335842 RepID=A0ABR1WJ27_9PEZI
MTEGFDFIIVGGGPSGCVIAARLAKSPARPSVLLLEAGGPNEDAAHLTGTERYEAEFREGSPLNWAYMTEPQVRGQKIDYSRGKGLGGSTAINFCGWVVGSSEDYDEWARLVGDDSFGWKNVRRCLQRIENFHDDVPVGFRERIAPSSEDHGVGGAVDLSYQKEWLPTTDDVFRAAEEVGLGINPDVNNGSPIGMGIGTACIYKGTRKIIFKQGVAVGVKVTSGPRFRARKEVIISGGAINSPQLLLLSGLGPEQELRKHGIPRVLDLPQIGRNLQDHCFSTAGIVIEKGSATTPPLQQSPSPMGWFQLPAVLSMRDMLRFFQAPTWKRKTVRHASWPQDSSDKAIWEAFSSNLRSSWHMAGTVTMGHNAQEACVDSSFNVIGMQNLRVADMSVCPLLPNNHTQSTAYIIGEIAAEKIVAEHGLNQVRAVL